MSSDVSTAEGFSFICSVGEKVCNAVMYLQIDAAHCQSNAQERVVQLAGHGGAQGKDGLSSYGEVHPLGH